MAGKPQSYANHRRFYPLFHFFVSPVLLLNFIIQLTRLRDGVSFDSMWAAAVAGALFGLALAARGMALVVQNRLISLEERLRLTRILPDELRSRIPEIRLGQLVALRFASDAEVPELTRRILAGEFAKADHIKRAIRDWRRDTLRV